MLFNLYHNIAVCLRVFVLMPVHCTIMCFGFRAIRIDGVSVIYFLFTHLLGRPCYAGDVYLYLCTERNEVRVTVCVIVL